MTSRCVVQSGVAVMRFRVHSAQDMTYSAPLKISRRSGCPPERVVD